MPTPTNITTAPEMTEKLVAEWLDAHYKPERLNRDGGTRGRLVMGSLADLRKYGTALISRHDSVSGRVEKLIIG